MDTLPPALLPPASPATIRPVDWADVEPLRVCCWPERSVIQVQRTVARALRLEARHYGCGVVAQAEGVVVGYGQMTHWPRAAEISNLIVCQAWRSRGIGTAMIQTLVHHAQQHAIARVEIGVAVGNTRALDLYRRLGFADRRVVTLELQGVRTPVLYLDLYVGDEH